MPGFADSFWSTDYAAGLGVLFGKLHQGVLENRQILTITRLRADAEETYGQRLRDIVTAADKITGGFTRDNGATARKAYDGMRSEMQDAAQSHQRIAENIRNLVVNPFSHWCDGHENRVQNSQDELQARIKAYDRQADTVRKLRSNYFNKCRLVEDLGKEKSLLFKIKKLSPSKASLYPRSKCYRLMTRNPMMRPTKLAIKFINLNSSRYLSHKCYPLSRWARLKSLS